MRSRWICIIAMFMLWASGACTKCDEATTPLDPGWESKWRDQNNGIADWFWCECHTAQPLEPDPVRYAGAPAPIRNLEDGYSWGLGQWIRIDPADFRLVNSTATPIDFARKDFEWRSAAFHCTTRAVCYSLLHMTPKGVCGDAPSGAEDADAGGGVVVEPPPGGGSGSGSGDYP